MLHENIHAKWFARMDSACADQFRSFVIDQQHFKYDANTSAFLKDLSSQLNCQVLRQIAHPWNARVKKKTTTTLTTNKQTKRTK